MNTIVILEDIEKKESKEFLTLKWGTLKAWNFESDEAIKLCKEYNDIGSCFGAMQQRDTPRQKEIICELVDVGNFETVYLDWDGKEVSKEEAKDYVNKYDKKS